MLTAALIPLPDTSRAAGNFQTRDLSRERWSQVYRRDPFITTLFLAPRNLSTFVKMSDCKLYRPSSGVLCVPEAVGSVFRELSSCGSSPTAAAVLPADLPTDFQPQLRADPPILRRLWRQAPLLLRDSRRQKPPEPGSLPPSSGLERLTCLQEIPGGGLGWSPVPAGETRGQFSPVSPARCLKSQAWRHREKKQPKNSARL